MSSAARQRADRLAYPERWREYNRRARVRLKQINPDFQKVYYRRKGRWDVIFKKYGLTREQWETMFAAQGHRCKICRCQKSGKQNWHTDHDPRTNVVRGILCCFCNHAIRAGTREDAVFLRDAAQYVESFL